MKLDVERVTLALRAPLRAAHGTLTERELLQVRLVDEDGRVGVGEAAPVPGYDRWTLADCAVALGAWRPLIDAWDGTNASALLDACRTLADVPHARAAVDMALWDLAGQRAGRPVVELLSDLWSPAVPVNASIGAEDRGTAAAAAAQARADGFSCVKVKVGIGDDAGRVAAVRAAGGPELAIRLDANGAWSVAEAEAALAALAPAGLELAEEPVAGLEALRELRGRVPVRIAMDESAGEPGALASGATDAVCLKVGRCGGIAATLAAASLVRATGAEAYLASAWDGPAGIAAALHAAAALRVELPCGLATLGVFADLEDPFPVRDGAIAVPTDPGLGL
jgi:o-succinylbenzoate synthase